MSIEDFNKALDDDQTFKILDVEIDDPWTLEHAAGCSDNENAADCSTSGDAPTKEYTGYLIEFEEGVFDQFGVPTLGHVYLESNRNVEFDVWYDVTSSRTCPPAALATAPGGTTYAQPVNKLAFSPH